ncbi:signal transduction histidine kinase [Anaerotaenia torta]|uniref:sensor histidine kinase n=1 Tax=Anaerotaenia torta TaxID=433293 RepID=UPI003D241FC3
MDTKLKSDKPRRAAGILVSALVILGVAAAMIASYQEVMRLYQRLADKLEKRRQENQEYIKEYYMEEFLDDLARNNYVLYWNMQMDGDHVQWMPSSVFLKNGASSSEDLPGMQGNEARDETNGGDGGAEIPEEPQEGSTKVDGTTGNPEETPVANDLEETADWTGADSENESSKKRVMRPASDGSRVYTVEETDFTDSFDSLLYRWKDHFEDSKEYYPNLEYAVFNHSPEGFLDEYYNSESLADAVREKASLKEKYSFYIIFEYNGEGILQITDFAGYSQQQMDQLLEECRNKYLFRNELDRYEQNRFTDQIKSPSNVTIAYASEYEAVYFPGGTVPYGGDHPLMEFSDGAFLYLVCIAAGIIVILALLLPLIKPLGIGGGLAAKLPLEFALAGVVLVVGVYEGLLVMAWETITDFFLTQPDWSVWSGKTLHILDYSFNFAVFAVLGGVLYLSVLIFRRCFVIGPKRYLKEQTLVGRLVILLVRLFKRLHRSVKKQWKSLSEIDLTDRSNRILIKILAVNFVVLALCCSIWVIGIAMLIPYSVLLFFLLRRYLDDIKRKYAILLETASGMAKGNLEVDIQEKLGIFEPLKQELAKVRHGFKKAVEEEMKSQRMKTDLVTNVSHDLKTPLTAIITYVDLLKDANITEEERVSYINTLDMKSQRLKRLIEDLFEVSKASSNNITLNYVEVDLAALIRQVLLELDDKLSRSEVELRLQIPEEKIMLELDSEKTYRIFGNLITNIIKYAMPRTRAYIILEDEGEQVVATLKNISAQEMGFDTQEITERFVRGDQSRNTEGSGLGLAIVKNFVELQGGSFEIIVDGDLFKAVITWKR